MSYFESHPVVIPSHWPPPCKKHDGFDHCANCGQCEACKPCDCEQYRGPYLVR